MELSLGLCLKRPHNWSIVLSFFIGDVSDDTPHLVAFMSTTGAGVGFMFARTGLGAASLSFEGFDFGMI